MHPSKFNSKLMEEKPSVSNSSRGLLAHPLDKPPPIISQQNKISTSTESSDASPARLYVSLSAVEELQCLNLTESLREVCLRLEAELRPVLVREEREVKRVVKLGTPSQSPCFLRRTQRSFSDMADSVVMGKH